MDLRGIPRRRRQADIEPGIARHGYLSSRLVPVISGTRPSAPTDQRTASAYIFGAICPKHGKGAALIMPRCNTEAMNLHLAEIAAQIAPGAHAALLVDQAGWHRGPARHAAQHHLDPVAGEMSGASSAGKRLAVPARQLALKPNLQILRRRRRPLLRGLEQPRRSTLADHVHRPSQLAHGS